MVARGLNPYRFGPSILGSGSFLSAVSPTWINTRAPYGPLFVGLDGFVVRHSANNLLAAVIGLRVLALLGVALLAIFLPRLAARHGVPATTALWLGLLNPLVLFHFVNGAHNDALMLGLLVAGLALAAERKLALGLVLCALAAAVKAPAVLGVAYVALDYATPPGSARLHGGHSRLR